jgi:hypothetical protein
MKTNKKYSYVVIIDNEPYLASESTLLDNKYKKSAKYAMFEKMINSDGSESLVKITYSSNITELQNIAANYVSWYNYPLNLSKNMQGYIKHIN